MEPLRIFHGPLCNDCGARATGTSPTLGPLCDACAERCAPPAPRCHDCGAALLLDGCPNGCEQLASCDACDAQVLRSEIATVRVLGVEGEFCEACRSLQEAPDAR